MNRFLIRLFLVTTLLCGMLGFRLGAKAQVFSNSLQQQEEQIQQSDGWLRQVAEEPQASTGTVVLSVPSSHRIASSRPTRILPTHGGKSNNHTGRWTKGNSFNPLSSPSLLLSRWRCCLCLTAASPRLLYVIALRRFLC